jgi:hypothetical protein
MVSSTPEDNALRTLVELLKRMLNLDQHIVAPSAQYRISRIPAVVRKAVLIVEGVLLTWRG